MTEVDKNSEEYKRDAYLTQAKNERTKIVSILIFTVVGLWGLTWWLLPLFLRSPADRGTFGDMFGVVNSLFSGLALAGIIYTIYVQKVELRLQRKELQMAREELRRTATAQEASGEALKEQVGAFLKISEFIEMSIHANRKMSTSKVTGGVINSPEKLQVRKIFGVHKQESLSIDQINSEVSKDPSLDNAIQKLLSDYDQICLGIQQGVYEEEIVKSSCEAPLIDTYTLLKNYIHHTRETGHPHAWLHLEQVVKSWAVVNV